MSRQWKLKDHWSMQYLLTLSPIHSKFHCTWDQFWQIWWVIWCLCEMRAKSKFETNRLDSVTYASVFQHPQNPYSWIERQRLSRQNINLPGNQKGYDTFETTVGKLLARRIQIFWVYFSVIIFDLLIFKTSESIPGRFGFVPSNTRLPRSQTVLKCLGWLANYFLVS